MWQGVPKMDQKWYGHRTHGHDMTPQWAGGMHIALRAKKDARNREISDIFMDFNTKFSI